LVSQKSNRGIEFSVFRIQLWIGSVFKNQNFQWIPHIPSAYLCSLRQAPNSGLESVEAQLVQCQCRNSELVSELDRANAAVSAQCVKVTELEKLVGQHSCQLDSLNAELQVSVAVRDIFMASLTSCR